MNNVFIGSFLSGLFRTVIPIVKKSGTALGQELIKSGVDFAGDVWKTGDIKQSKNRRGKEFINKLSNRMSDHMFGSGYSRALELDRAQLKRSVAARKARKTTKSKATKSKTKKRKTTKKKPAKRKAGKKNSKAVSKKRRTTKNKRTKQDIQDFGAFFS